MPTVRETRALLRMLSRYSLTIGPVVRAELRLWKRHADAIPDPTLRAHALGKLRDEKLNAEAAATFAGLVSRRHRATAVRLMVAFEVMYDYLDAVSEQPVPEPILNGRQLHSALTAAVGAAEAESGDFYRHHPAQDDGGYVERLVNTCRANLEGLPSARVIAPVAARAAARCGEAQTRTHAVASHGAAQLSQWASETAADGFVWWEYAAGATASLGVHALFAAAGNNDVTLVEAERVDVVYHPAICALATLLDSLIDHDDDTPGIDHRYVAYYPTPAAAADRIAAIAREAITRAQTLRHGPSHAIIVAGIACFYLSTPHASGAFGRAADERILAAIGPVAAPILAILRARRQCGSRS